jgi:hypothetical protein
MDDIPSGSQGAQRSPRGSTSTHLSSARRSEIRSPRVRAALTVMFVAVALILLIVRENPAAFFAARTVLFPPALPTPTLTAIPTLTLTEILRHRPLRIPLLAPGGPCPTTPGRALDPALAEVVGDGPVYVALGTADTLGYAPPQNFGSQEWGGQRTFWAVQPGFEGLVC